VRNTIENCQTTHINGRFKVPTIAHIDTNFHYLQGYNLLSYIAINAFPTNINILVNDHQQKIILEI